MFLVLSSKLFRMLSIKRMIFFLQGLYQIFIRPGVWIAVVFFLVSLAIFGSRWVSNKESAGPSRGYYGVVLIISVVLCALSILPYALVGKYPSPFSWDDRHYLTFSIVFPIFVLSFIRFLLGKFYYLALCLFLGVFFYERLYQG